jgi:hypothetical protein
MSVLSLEVSIPEATIDSVVLSDSTGTFGIKRNSDDVVIVSDGTVTVQSGDIYSYTTGLLDPDEAYTAVFQVDYTPDGGSAATEYITVSIPVSSSLRSLRNLRRQLSRRLGGFEKHEQETDSPATDKVYSADLIGSNPNATAYDNTWIYIATGNHAGQQRLASNGGFDDAAGTVQLVSAFDAAVPAAHTIWEVHSKLPAIEANRTLGLREVLNQALEVMWTIKRETFTGDGTEMFLVGEGRDWLTSEAQIVDVYVPADSTGTYRPYSAGKGYQFRYNAEAPRLEGAALDADEAGWELEVIRPAHTWIKHGGAWGDSLVGLQDDDDETMVAPQALIPVALYFAYLALAVAPHETPKERQYWEGKALTWSVVAARILEDWLPKPDRNPQRGHSSLPRYGMKGLLGW